MSSPLSSPYSAATTETQDGTVTSFLPLSTPWSSKSDCSSQIYQQPDGHLIAFDPYYRASISPSAVACFAPEITAWWSQQTQASGPPTPTVLGPEFVCPGLYTPAATGLVNSVTTQLFCCPSGYSLDKQITLQGAAFPSQCVSTITDGQVLAYDYFTEVGALWSRTTGTVSATAVNAMHVNGYNIRQTSSTSSSQSAFPVPTSRTRKNSDTNSDGLTVGATTGIAIACMVVVMLACIGWFVWYRKSKIRKGEVVPMVYGGRPPQNRGRREET